MKDSRITAALIIATAIVVAACNVYTGLSNVSTNMLRAGQDVGLQIRTLASKCVVQFRMEEGCARGGCATMDREATVPPEMEG